MKRIHQKFSSGFTLIELLVVITILGVLATLALVTLNPAEAQKKARDTQRLKDMAVIQSIVEQYLTDNPGIITLTNADSSAMGSNSCLAGWLKTALGGSVCAYANVLPTDPSNRVTKVTNNMGVLIDSPAPGAVYRIRFSGGAYKICTYLESAANATKLKSDGEATINDVFSVFSSDAITCP